MSEPTWKRNLRQMTRSSVKGITKEQYNNFIEDINKVKEKHKLKPKLRPIKL